MRALDSYELESVGGGIYPILAFAVSAFVFGYGVGKDMALREGGC